VLGHVDHTQQADLLVALLDLGPVLDHLLEEAGEPAPVPLHELVPKLELLDHLAQVHHLLEVRAQVHELLVLVAGLVVVLLVEEGSVDGSRVDPLLLLLEGEGDVEQVEVEGADFLPAVLELHLAHEDELVEAEGLPLREQVVQLEQQPLLELLCLRVFALEDFLVEFEQYLVQPDVLGLALTLGEKDLRSQVGQFARVQLLEDLHAQHLLEFVVFVLVELVVLGLEKVEKPLEERAEGLVLTLVALDDEIDCLFLVELVLQQLVEGLREAVGVLVFGGDYDAAVEVVARLLLVLLGEDAFLFEDFDVTVVVVVDEHLVVGDFGFILDEFVRPLVRIVLG